MTFHFKLPSADQQAATAEHMTEAETGKLPFLTMFSRASKGKHHLFCQLALPVRPILQIPIEVELLV